LKRCFKCGRNLPIDEFYRHPRMRDGHIGKCKDCARRDVAAHRLANIETVHAYDRERSKRPKRRADRLASRRVEPPIKRRARRAVAQALHDGRLVRQPCEHCGNESAEAHHDDYSQPLAVRWLCFKHHRELAHSQIVTATR